MIKNYLTIAYRNLLRNKGYTLINILGLSIGLSCCILLLLFIKDELSYDRFHEKSDRIYRIVAMFPREGNPYYHPHTPAPLAPALRNDCPEVLRVTRFGSGRGNVITYGDIQTRENRFSLADPNVFDVFTIPLIRGDPQSALNDLSSVVISEDLAHKYFPNEDPMGKILQIGGESYQQDYQVTGVFKNLPPNSSLQFDCLASFQRNYTPGNEGNLTWGAHNYITFVLLPADYKPENLESKLPQIASKYIDEKFQPETEALRIQYRLQSLNKIHLDLDPRNKLPTERDSAHIYLFAGIALLILLIACINFINLATARSSRREKEVGIRKVAGAQRLDLVKQFLGESIILTLLALLLSLPIVEILLPVFNQYVDKQLVFIHYDNLLFLIGLLILTLFVGILAGGYPAFMLSSFKPAAVLRRRIFSGNISTKTGLRKILVVVQFAISIIFITCTLVMHSQLRYIKNKNLGYDKEHLVVIPIHDQHVKPKYELYKTGVLRNVNVLSATATSYLPSKQGYYQNVYFKDPAQKTMSYINWIPVDYDFIETMGLELIRGRNFSRDFSTDAGMTYILNESAIKQADWDNPLGKQMKIAAWGPVIGVIKDFHFESLHNQIQPMALCMYPELFRYLLIRITPENISGTLGFLREQWAEIFPNRPFEYQFFDDDFNRVYKADLRGGSLFNFITGLALFVACLGLFGLVSMTAISRTKEIGIRKVLGASSGQLISLLSREFLVLVLLANLIAWPVAWFAMDRWLRLFAYRIDPRWWISILAGLAALGIALATVSWQTVRAATANPVESLRYE